jgi:hypothetical protein
MIQKSITVRTVLELGQELLQERRRSYELSRQLEEMTRELNRAKHREQDARSSRNGAAHQAEVLRRQMGQERGRRNR